jgi:hypothetical protein
VTDREHALHEAGHAVMASLLGVGVRRVALLPGAGGITELDALVEDGREVRTALVILAAGDAAQASTRLPDPVDGWRL